MARLMVADGSTFELAGGEMLVGRGEREIDDPPKINVGPLRGSATVSRRHARLREHVGRWYLQVDGHSTNPTLVDGFVVPKGTEVPLNDGSNIQLGEVALTFRGPSAGAAGAELTITPEDVVHLHRQHEPIQSTAAPIQSTAPPIPDDVAPPQTEGWAVRLPTTSPAIDALGLPELRRINPFRGLMIDEETWADAHDYHRNAQRLHLLTGHGSGIVEGLEVLADPRSPDSLVVRPGIAIDARGQVLLLTHEVHLPLAGQDGQTRYVAARHVDEPTAPQRYWSDEDEHTRIVERCQVTLERTPPLAPALELARLVVAVTVRDALDPTNPHPGEIDLRFRERLLVRPRPDLAVAQLVVSPNGEPTASHRLGLRFLLREIGLTTPYRPRWAGEVHLDEPLPPAALLYCPGSGAFSADAAALARLGEFLHGGGILWADPCRGGDWEPFAETVHRLASQLGLDLQPVTRWHPLLSSRHVLPETLALGADGGVLLEAGGVVLSTGDHGCAWQGGRLDSPIGRESIRDALELGTNVAVHARQRQRPLDVLDLEG
jgi:pSer/pThr/pTyr-binding forkhead associated (FHA) protein